MPARALHSPWEYLREASPPSLQSFELTRLNHAAHLRKEIATLVDQWLEETACALLARWLFDHQADLRAPPPAAEEPRALEEGDPFRDAAAPLTPARSHPGSAVD